MNLFCGLMGVIFTFKGDFQTAFILMLAAAACDFCDGFAARMLNAYSDMGKELDSLADMVSFGALPALMLHRLMIYTGEDGILSYILPNQDFSITCFLPSAPRSLSCLS